MSPHSNKSPYEGERRDGLLGAQYCRYLRFVDILLTELFTAVWRACEHNTRERERDVVSIGGALEVKSLYIMTVLGRLQGPMKTCSWQDARNNVIEDSFM